MVIETTYRIIITKLVVSFFFFWLVTDAILSSFVTVFSLVYPEDKWVLSKLNLPVFVFFKNIFKVL